jgi:prolyl-tRNA editing enzyme YbaK/EbsC (Cys-tRNA(Pro) deacylase)
MADPTPAAGKTLRASALRVQEALAAFGRDFEVVEFDASTRTSADAAAAIGCDVAQIAKSLVFRAKPSGRPVLVLASGANRVDEKKIEAVLGEGLGRADADYVRDKTGFVIGGVPPIGHAAKPATFIDRDLLRHGEIWAAAGTPHAVFRLSPADLVEMTGGTVLEIA